MGHKHLAVLTGDRFNNEGFFYKELYELLARWQKSGRNNEVTVLPTYRKAWFQCNPFFFFLAVSREALCLASCLRNTHNYNVLDGRNDSLLAAGEMTQYSVI